MQHRQILHLVFGYALIGALYILFSDQLLHFVAPDVEALKNISILKGLGFIAVTALTLWWLLIRMTHAEDLRRRALEDQHKAELLQSFLEDQKEIQRHQRELERSNQLLAMLSEFNQSVVRATDRSELFQAACSLAVSHGGFRIAWIGMINPEGVIVPVATAGDDTGYVDQIQATLSENSLRGLGPTGVALRSGTPSFNNDFLGDPHTILWHAAAENAGIRSTAALPIRNDKVFIGSLNLYASERNVFGPREQQTLRSVMEDLQYALSYLDNLQALQVTMDVVEASPAVLFRWRNAPDWPVLFVTHNVDNWGYSAASLMAGRVQFSQLMHPDDLQRVSDEVAQHVTDKHERYEQEYRIVTADKRVRWVIDQTVVNYNAEGIPEFFQGVLTDITDKKESEGIIEDYVERLEKAFLGTTLAVSQLVELRDPYTAGHEKRVGELAAAIAAELGYDEHMQNGLRAAGALHDVGKMMVPVEILSKPGKLTPIEMDLIRLHPEEGYKVLKDVPFPWPVADVARQHHERLDGSGYPQGLRGEQICFEARIIAVADLVESMSSHRPYRAARGLDQALAEMEAGSGTLYDPVVVAACLRLFRDKGYRLEASLPGTGE